MKATRTALAAAALLAAGCGPATPAQTAPPGAAVADTSAAPVTAVAVVLAGPEEPGEPLTFAGRVLDYAGRPLARAAVVAYQADATGRYNPPEADTRVPRLRAVAVTDSAGGFRFTTVRPGPYPDGSEPAHIHLDVTAPAHRLRYVTYWFDGDPLATPEARAVAAREGEVVVVGLRRDGTGAWAFTHDIRLEGN